MKPLSFRGRVALAMGALILVIAAVISIYLPRKFEQEAIAIIGHKAETLAELTAFTIHPSIYFGDRAALAEALSGTRRDKDVAYVVVTDPAGTRLAEFHPERATPEALARRTGGGMSRDGSLYEVMLPIQEQGRELARLYIGMSLARLNREVLQMRVAIGALTAFILAAGLLAVILISNVLTRPLRDVAAGAQRIAAGDLGHRVAEGREDEIGQLATSFNDMAARVAERDASLRQLSKRMLSVQEKERVRIAREVHDELGQALTAMKIDLQQLGIRHPAVIESLVPISRAIDETVDLVRRIATDLRPAVLDDLGVTAALEQQLRRLRESSGLKTTLTVSEEPELDMLTGVTLYRIAQEGLANVIRHAQASEVEVSLSIEEGAAVLEIRDNGKGMSREQITSSRSLGLLGMRERAELLGGHVAIESRPGEGTVVRATLPLSKDDRKDDPNRASTVR
ncbi:MAG TPA: ATP-binding protein [Thermoanaerobaculia bacterium]|jgi:signal transduction histidine kinase|nr:ATP-binding protein [Thermoanaerobaculia bacterium]